MWVYGYVHETYESAFLANVQIVSKWTADHRAGGLAGYMELTDGTDAIVYKHPAGTFYGYVVGDTAE